MLSKVKQIHAKVSIKRERVLPVPGVVLVRRMQKVTPTDVILVAPMKPEVILLDIALGLNVSPERADELLQRQSGDELVKGDVIAGPVGIFQRVIRAPGPGLVKISGEGKVLFELSSEPYELQAGMDGTVTGIIPERGAIIETSGALIQGVWGNGKITYGVVQPISSGTLQELVPETLNIGFRGVILTAGYCQNPKALEAAGNVPIKGLILGSISSKLVPLAKSIAYPILVIDGFGELPMNRAAEEILLASKERNIALNAQEFDAFLGKYPELIISQTSQSATDLPKETDTLKVGKKVIVISGPEKNMIGNIEAIPAKKQRLDSEILTRVAVVSLPNNQSAVIPLNNLEILL